MNCCDEYGNCNQGRDCPVRAARVARIGRKDHAREALPRSLSRVYLHHLAKWMLVFIAVLFAAALVMGIAQARPSKSIDCRTLIGGWHPDVPAQIAMQCRKANHA
jgi:hypothetical protein